MEIPISDDFYAYMLVEVIKRRFQTQPQEENPEDHEVTSQASEAHQIPIKKRRTDKIHYPQLENHPMKKKQVEEDDTDETLIELLQWKEIQPGFIDMLKDVAEEFSKPIMKQLRDSDVKNDQSRLMLRKIQVRTEMIPLLTRSEYLQLFQGLDVSVYGQDGEVQEMKFKMWNTDTPVLTSGWKEFVAKYELEKHCDFLKISMFRHKETGKICFAIEATTFDSIANPVSKRISNSVFSNQN